MRRKLLITAMISALVAVGGFSGVAAPAGAAAAPAPLVLSQSAAFGILGVSCGGIQEQSFATGFDPTTGFPTGDVHLQTRCGGSGRGGGYHTTTYVAWVGVTWDFTASVVSAARLAAAPSVDPAFSAFDAFGNEVYNVANVAYLSLAPGFVAVPRVTGVSVTEGPASGGTSVTITGTGMSAATGVSFGSVPATFTVNSDTTITAVSPGAPGGTVDVTVTSPGGTSTTSAIDQFTFVAAPTVTSLSPTVGPIAGGTEVTINGTGLSGATTVTFGDTAAGFSVNDDSSITAFAPTADAADTVAVTVTTIGGTSTTGPADQFTYVVVPDAPTGVSAISGDGAAVVRWTAPANNGVPITGYVVTPFVAGVAQSPVTFATTATTQTIAGLTNGTAYTFTVAATNASATGPESVASFPLVVGAPKAPALVRSLSGATVAITGPIVVSFVPGANNGAAITGYTATCRSSNGGVVGVKSGATGPLAVAGLTTGKLYTCTVRATNARGTGYPSPASAAVIVGSPAPPFGVVGARTAAGQITVTFTLGANNGSAITSVMATCTSTNGGVTASTVRVGASSAPISVAGLTVGATYICRVKAINARGAGLWSGPSAAVVA